MKFEKYQHIEKLGTVETKDLLMGMCYIFPKIDGTNSSVWLNKELGLCAGSRNRELSLEKDNAGFYEWVLKQNNILDFLWKYDNLRLYGEWLVPHTLKTYSDDAWRKFYVFDVMDGGRYLSYDEYSVLLDEYNIEYIPPLCKVKNPLPDRLYGLLDQNKYLIKDGEGAGEGIVIKRYDFINRFGRTTWAKVVRNEFKSKHVKSMGVTEVKEIQLFETKIIDKYVTADFVQKEYAKIAIDGWTSKMIPRLLNTVFYTLVKEFTWDFVKENKNPKIDFALLMRLCYQKVKEVKAELF